MAEPTNEQHTPQPPSPLQTQNLTLTASPPLSASPTTPSPTLSHKRSRSPLSIDLSNIPPLQQPAPPSNTLLITRLDDSKIFHPASIATIRAHINSIAPLNSFSPLKSMHRIICSFYDVDSTIAVRQAIDGTAFLGGSVAKCYFGEPTPIGDEKMKYLERPDAGRLFFISPPPSPPVGWEMRSEDPPNKQVHADDLAAQLEKLGGRLQSLDDSSEQEDDLKQYSAEELAKVKASSHPHARSSAAARSLADQSPTTGSSSPRKGHRSRSSTLIYDPKAHGDSPALPAVMLETEDDSEVELDDGKPSKKILAHTERPPVELMEH